jgi:hypothetical protein
MASGQSSGVPTLSDGHAQALLIISEQVVKSDLTEPLVKQTTPIEATTEQSIYQPVNVATEESSSWTYPLLQIRISAAKYKRSWRLKLP